MQTLLDSSPSRMLRVLTVLGACLAASSQVQAQQYVYYPTSGSSQPTYYYIQPNYVYGAGTGYQYYQPSYTPQYYYTPQYAPATQPAQTTTAGQQVIPTGYTVPVAETAPAQPAATAAPAAPAAQPSQPKVHRPAILTDSCRG